MSAATDTAAAPTAPRTAPPLLEARGLRASYGAVEALHGIDFHVDRGETIVFLGANGAGKTTTLRSICRLVSTKGELLFDGESVVGKSATAVIRKGIATVPQGRGTLTDLSVEDNLRAGAYLRKDRGAIGAEIERWYEVFPRLGQRRRISAGSPIASSFFKPFSYWSGCRRRRRRSGILSRPKPRLSVSPCTRRSCSPRVRSKP